MRVAYVCADPGVPVFGRKGCSVHVQEVIRAFLHRGAAVDLFAPRLDGIPQFGLEAVRVHPLPRGDATDVAARERACVRANRELHEALERSGPFDLVYERYSLWSFAAMEYARASAIPALLEVNAPLVEEQARHRALVDRKTAESVARRSFAAASAVLAVSAEVAEAVACYEDARVPIHVVPNGVDVNRFNPDVPACSAASDSFTVGFVGTLKPWHGLMTLVRAFDVLAGRHENVRLLIVGDGPGANELRSDLHVRGLDGASVVTGAVDSAMVPSLLTSMTVAVAPYSGSHATFYFSPLKVFEYMAAGLPIVASRLGQLTAVLEDGMTALLCHPDDPHSLAEALERLYRDAPLRARLGRASRQRAEHQHSWDAVCGRLLDIGGLRAGEGVVGALG